MEHIESLQDAEDDFRAAIKYGDEGGARLAHARAEEIRELMIEDSGGKDPHYFALFVKDCKELGDIEKQLLEVWGQES